ncbi:MAG: D-glycerate dehydrogenase [Phycisphaerae bacterium]|nr:D-glycerate dehydrogenase [Phycisphaerae bacterium]
MSQLPKVVITGAVPVRGRAIGAAPEMPGVEVVMAPVSPKPTPEELRGLVRGADVIISMFYQRVDVALLDAAGMGLRGIVNYAVGFDNIDLGACRERGLLVANTPDAVTEGTANLAWGLILACARRLVEADGFVRSGAWEKQGPLSITDFLGVHLTGRTLLIVGAGRIGKAVGLRGLAFGMRVEYAARSRHVDFELAPLAARRVELDEGLARADVVSIHTPLTPETRHLIDARRLGLMKREAILINTARGPIVDEAALASALQERRLWGAGLDVFEREPRVDPLLREQSNAVMAPHIGSAERYWREVMTEMVCENARAMLEGKRPPNLLS